MTIKAREPLAEIGYYMVGISKLPGFEQPIKLSSNESALGMSPDALTAAQQAMGQGHLYPEVDTETLAEVLGERYHLDPQRMAFGPGSDELLGRIVNTFSGPGDELIHSKNAYMQFPIYAKLAGATPVAAPDLDFHYDVDAAGLVLRPVAGYRHAGQNRAVIPGQHGCLRGRDRRGARHRTCRPGACSQSQVDSRVHPGTHGNGTQGVSQSDQFHAGRVFADSREDCVRGQRLVEPARCYPAPVRAG